MKKRQRLWYVLFPNRCLVCNEVIGWEGHLCRRCREEEIAMLPPLCPLCGRSESLCICGGHKRHYARCVTPMPYTERLHGAVARLKEQGCGTTADGFAAEMAEVLRREYGGIPFDCVTPVPLHEKELRRRGFNQAALLAKRLAALLQVPYAPLLTKPYETLPQKTLPALERQGNLLGAFAVEDAAAAQGKTVLLVDDVITTGATLDECAKMLKLAGAAEVYGITAAGTVPKATKDGDSPLQNRSDGV